MSPGKPATEAVPADASLAAAPSAAATWGSSGSMRGSLGPKPEALQHNSPAVASPPPPPEAPSLASSSPARSTAHDVTGAAPQASLARSLSRKLSRG